MDLEFCVNEQGSLESKQLRCMFDFDQDAGTWYGLRSMLVLRDVRNRHQRSAIIPMGSPRYELKGYNVEIQILNDGCYGQYSINCVLGRLQCVADSQLLLMKAQLHAYTSLPLPDSLTGRTGTEEALTCLSSAIVDGLGQATIPTLGRNSSINPMTCLLPDSIQEAADCKME